MRVQNLFVAAGVAVSQGLFAAAQPNSCPGGSVPYFECDFAGGSKECEKGVNLGVLANPTQGECSVPSPSNGCMLKPDRDTMAWMWESNSNTRCCNCYPLKSPCPLGSVPFLKCDFHQRGGEKCVKGANTGAMAQADNGMCDVPSPENECMLEVNTETYAWEFKSKRRGVRCCNCFMVESSSGSNLLQAKQQVRRHGRSLRRGHEEGDAASMLQLPFEEGEGSFDEALDEELLDAEQAKQEEL